jgi:type IV fimbrial biogenesis protein FimT
MSQARHTARGFTFTETLAALTVALLTLGSALPGFDALRERRQLDGTAAQLATDLKLARSEAVALQRDVRVSFASDAAGSCYVVHTGGAQECQCGASGPVCSGSAQALRHQYLAADGVRVAANVGSMLIDAERGTVTPTATLRVSARDGRAIHHVVNIMGRLRSCSPGGAVSGLPVC